MLEPQGNESQEVDSSYRIISYKGTDLPKDLLNVIRAPFLNSLRYGNELFKLIDKEAYFNSYGPYVDSLISRPKSVVQIAILSDETVLGWALIEQDCLHYVWVKKEVRHQGIAKSLIPNNIKTFTHITNKGLSIWPKYNTLKFNPFK